MTDLEAKLANVAAIEQYGKVMKAKGLHARAKWAHDEARRLRNAIGPTGFAMPRAA